MPWRMLTALPAGYAGGGLGRPVHLYLKTAYPGPRLYVCSGWHGAEYGIGVDVNREVGPDVQAAAEALPFKTSSFRTVICDPPWDGRESRKRYGTRPVREVPMIQEAARVLKPEGYLLIAGWHVPPANNVPVLQPAGVHVGFPVAPQKLFAVFVYRRRRTLEETKERVLG